MQQVPVVGIATEKLSVGDRRFNQVCDIATDGTLNSWYTAIATKRFKIIDTSYTRENV